jgi:hypothetical protein
LFNIDPVKATVALQNGNVSVLWENDKDAWASLRVFFVLRFFVSLTYALRCSSAQLWH